MKTSMMMDFSIDRENKSVHVRRSFAADQKTVWAAWTQPDLLDKWWAPRPFVAKTKSMDFKVGGRRLYAMMGPNGEEHWALADYTSITPITNFTYLDAFCDADGNLNPDFPRSDWDVHFDGSGDTTEVHVVIKHTRLEDLEMIIKLGFKEGFTLALGHLDELLGQ
ncbi:MAG: SRPBCC domain-containing protein [Saprospiraceae bacterium]|nr:SRPBCC domain-containing protein [Saprospiraceae bacterium]MCB9317827.1 SRPBCC domain-containing protein [Lewinellaceae bacterium]